jgi:DNA-binding NarL/FixJ family response regulator
METNTAAPLQQRVFVVEDSPQVLDRIEVLVDLAGACTAGHATQVKEATRAILEQRPEIVVLDVHLADGSGFDVLRALRRLAPEIDVYMFTNYAADAYRNLAEKLGARGLFDKSREFDRLREAIAQRVAAQQ